MGKCRRKCSTCSFNHTGHKHKLPDEAIKHNPQTQRKIEKRIPVFTGFFVWIHKEEIRTSRCCREGAPTAVRSQTAVISVSFFLNGIID